jgi:hypothetical protein
VPGVSALLYTVPGVFIDIKGELDDNIVLDTLDNCDIASWKALAAFQKVFRVTGATGLLSGSLLMSELRLCEVVVCTLSESLEGDTRTDVPLK